MKYQNGRGHNHVIGKTKFIERPKAIAYELSAGIYNFIYFSYFHIMIYFIIIIGHSYHRTSATLLADSDSGITTL